MNSLKKNVEDSPEIKQNQTCSGFVHRLKDHNLTIALNERTQQKPET
jgi:hypothetical protein